MLSFSSVFEMRKLFILVTYLPPPNEVWGKVMFSQVSVHRGSTSRVGGLHPGGV